MDWGDSLVTKGSLPLSFFFARFFPPHSRAAPLGKSGWAKAPSPCSPCTQSSQLGYPASGFKPAGLAARAGRRKTKLGLPSSSSALLAQPSLSFPVMGLRHLTTFLALNPLASLHQLVLSMHSHAQVQRLLINHLILAGLIGKFVKRLLATAFGHFEPTAAAPKGTGPDIPSMPRLVFCQQ